MKEVKTFIITEIIIAILKLLAGVVCHSYTMIASCLYEVILIITSLFVHKHTENKRYKGIITSVLGFVIALSSLFLIFASIIDEAYIVSWLVLLFIIICMLVRYLAGCFYTNINYQKKKGILGYSTINSNVDFYNYGVVLGVLILGKLSKWFGILKYADKLGVILISVLIIINGIKLVRNSFKNIENIEVDLEPYKDEISKRSEVKKLGSVITNDFGGIRKVKCSLVLNNGISMIDINTFVVSLQDYLLKVANVVEVNLLDDVKPKKVRVRSLKQDARNSRSGNSKTNTKKKNTTKKNKKR